MRSYSSFPMNINSNENKKRIYGPKGPFYRTVMFQLHATRF